MVKIVTVSLLLFITLLNANEPPPLLQKNCLNCHISQKIPSELIYRRYLLRYSTHKIIRQTLFNYLKDPKKKTSIMPKQFFLKFPEKEALDLNQTVLQESIDAYLNYFDVRGKLILP